MFKKLTILVVLLCFLTLQACGTLLKSERIGKPNSGKLDVGIVALDAIGLVLFIIPGIIAFSVDYLNGTIFLPNGQTAKLQDMSPEAIQKVLAKNNINISLDELKEGKLLALHQ